MLTIAPQISSFRISLELYYVYIILLVEYLWNKCIFYVVENIVLNFILLRILIHCFQTIPQPVVNTFLLSVGEIPTSQPRSIGQIMNFCLFTHFIDDMSGTRNTKILRISSRHERRNTYIYITSTHSYIHISNQVMLTTWILLTLSIDTYHPLLSASLPNYILYLHVLISHSLEEILFYWIVVKVHELVY